MSVYDLLALCEKMVAEGKGDNYVYAHGYLDETTYPATAYEDADGDLVVEAA